MEVTAQQLWERLQNSGLASAATCQSWRNSISLSVGAANLEDARRIASELIRTRKLTPYQCNALFEQSTPLLKIGHYAVVDSLVDTLGANWVEVRDQRKTAESPSSEPNSSCWAFLLSPSGLKNSIVKQFPPSLELAKQHLLVQESAIPKKDGAVDGTARQSGLDPSYLDHWGEVQTLDGAVLVTCAPIPGVSLKQLLASDGPLSMERSILLVRRIAQSLKPLHRAGLTHGSLAARSVSVFDNDQVVVRRDILFPPSSPYYDRSVSMLNLGALERYAIAAPELSVQNVSPSPASDLYALGVLWGTMLQGKLPWSGFESFDIPVWKESHRSRPVELPHGTSDAIVDCIGHLTGKNPSSRFASVEQFLMALDRITRPSKPQKATGRDIGTSGSPGLRNVGTADNVIPLLNEDTDRHRSAKRSGSEVDPSSWENVLNANVENPSTPDSNAGNSDAGDSDAGDSDAGDRDAGDRDAGFEDFFQPSKPLITSGRKKGRGISKASKPLADANLDKVGSKFANSTPSKFPKWVIPGSIAASLLLAGGVGFWALRSGKDNVGTNTTVTSGSGTSETGNNRTSDPNRSADNSLLTDKASQLVAGDPGLNERFELHQDNGENLWLPPFSPNPIALDLLPMGCELLLAFNGATWANTEKFAELLPWVQESLPQWQDFASKFRILELAQKTQPSEILVALYPDTINDSFDAVLRFQFAAPMTIESLLSHFQGYSVQNFAERPGTGFYLSGELGVAFEGAKVSGTDTVMSMSFGPASLLNTLSETGGGAPPLRRQLEVLHQNSNRNSDLYLLATPAFLKGNGRTLLETAPQIISATDSLLNERVQAISYSGQLGEQWYSELRLVLTNAATLQTTRDNLKQQLAQMPEVFEKHFADVPPAPYWSVLAMRYPFMLRSVAKNVRWGIEDGQLIANAYLPNSSLSNLVVTSWMALQDPEIGKHTEDKLVPDIQNVPSESLDKLLARPISIAFAQESLDMALAAIGTEFNETVMKGSTPIEFVINGAAFQKEGITQNMQIRDFDHASKPLSEVLTDLVRRANPVTTVQSPTEADQKVVWLLRGDAADTGANTGKQRVELTTRNWATENQVTLPPVFISQ